MQQYIKFKGKTKYDGETFERNIYIGWLCVIKLYPMAQVARAFKISKVRVGQIVRKYVKQLGQTRHPSIRLLPACVQPIQFIDGDQ